MRECQCYCSGWCIVIEYLCLNRVQTLKAKIHIKNECVLDCLFFQSPLCTEAGVKYSATGEQIVAMIRLFNSRIDNNQRPAGWLPFTKHEMMRHSCGVQLTDVNLTQIQALELHNLFQCHFNGLCNQWYKSQLNEQTAPKEDAEQRIKRIHLKWHFSCYNSSHLHLWASLQ